VVLRRSFVRVIVLTLREPQRATLVKGVIELPSLVRQVLVVLDVWAWRVMPISYQTIE
jgi:hypothetical protein